jgi:hypothetical protein
LHDEQAHDEELMRMRVGFSRTGSRCNPLPPQY